MPDKNKRGGRSARVNRSGNPAVRSSAPKPAPAGSSSPAPRRPGRSAPIFATSSTLPEPLLPPPGVGYPQLLRNEQYAPWRTVLGVVMGLSFFILLTNLVSQLVVFVSWSLFGSSVPYATYVQQALAFERPSGMLAANLGIATLIPVSCILIMLLHRMQPRWLASVQGRMRWSYFGVCLGVAVVALLGVQALSSVVAAQPFRFAPQPGVWMFLVIIVVTSPLQAAAEEVFFRGYLLQALGGLVRQPWVGIVLSALVFALFHGTQNLPLFIDRFAFGLLAAALVWRTGGLEASIAAHVVNNIFAYAIAGLTGSIAALKAVREIGWVDAAFDVGGFALFAALAWLVASRMRPANRTGPVRA